MTTYCKKWRGKLQNTNVLRPSLRNCSSQRIAQINANSIKEHLLEIETFLVENRVDVLSISETWLTPLHETFTFNIAGYNLIRNDRGLKSNITSKYIQGGGVACFVRDSLRYTIVDSSQITDINETEYLIFSIECRQKLLLGSIYRRPKGRTLSQFFATFQNISYSYENIVLAGDLNSDLIKENAYGAHLRKLLFEHSLYLVPFEATHHRENSDTWLDVIAIDPAHKLVAHEKSEAPFINGHDYLIIDYQFDVPLRKH